MALAPTGRRGIKADINVTPLVDVVLVLLIIFMVITPMLQRGKAVHLPKAALVEKGNVDAESLVVTLTAAGEVYFEQQLVDAEQLKAHVRRRLSAVPDQKLLIKADERLSCGEVRRVLAIIRDSGAKGVSLGVEEAR